MQVPGNCRNMKVNVRVQDLTGQPALLPIWIFAYRYRDRLFRFLVNGQNGQCTGTAPTSMKKVAAVSAAVVLAVVVILVILFSALSR
jgi:hypothetical protein